MLRQLTFKVCSGIFFCESFCLANFNKRCCHGRRWRRNEGKIFLSWSNVGRNALTERQRIRIGHYQRQECFEPAAPLPPERREPRTEQFVPAAAPPPPRRPARRPPLQNAEITSTTRATEARPVEVIVISDDDI
ncbi:Hypothetical predicted protein [Paramuricea clavata]|uniref:Uncharacterized protein n=1 Tax=Paramuricea clavata TaxID=317549 RepID=A0A6S7IFI9_PARCT|nr:Hypothetical predicted protein [Paramuricea clavata]